MIIMLYPLLSISYIFPFTQKIPEKDLCRLPSLLQRIYKLPYFSNYKLKDEFHSSDPNTRTISEQY